MQMILTHISCQNNPASTHITNTHTEILLANQTYNIMTLKINSLTFTDKYTALLQQELQNPYWNLHDPIMIKVTKSQKTWT